MSVRELFTLRLRLRGWRAEDSEEMAAINADPRVGEWLGGSISILEKGSATYSAMRPAGVGLKPHPTM